MSTDPLRVGDGARRGAGRLAAAALYAAGVSAAGVPAAMLLTGCQAVGGSGSGAVTVVDPLNKPEPPSPPAAARPAAPRPATPPAGPADQPANIAARGAGGEAAPTRPGLTPTTRPKNVPLAPAVAARLRERAIELLTTAAGSGRAEVRANAIEALADAPRRLEPLLPRLLGDPSPAVRAVAAMAVGKAKIARFQPQLRVLVNASDPNPLARDIVRSSAIFALMRTGVDANPGVLADMLQSGEPRLRAHVAYLLGELGNPSAASLIRDASREPAPLASPQSIGLMQLQMNEALFKLGDTKAMDAVRSALYPASVEDLERTVLAAQIIGQVRAQAGRPDLNNLLARALDPQRGAMPAEVRIAAAGGMVRLGEVRAVDVVLDYLGDPEPAVRSQALAVVGETRLAEWLWYVQPMLDDRDPLVVVAAARAVLRLTEGGTGGG